MASERDHYEVLGIPRSASAADVHRAFRRLARRYHPDINSGGDARRRFEEASTAYEVLHDPQRRARYDRFTAGAQAADPATPVFVNHRGVDDVPRFLDDAPQAFVEARPRPVTVIRVRWPLW